MKPATAIQIGQIFLDKAKEIGVKLTTLQLLKLVYIAHGWMLGAYKEPLVKDDALVYTHGPVFPKLYNKIKHTRGEAIEERIANTIKLDEYQESIVDYVFNNYGHYTGWYLSGITHTDDSPWDICYKKRESKIPNEIIQEHYAELAEEKLGITRG